MDAVIHLFGPFFATMYSLLFSNIPNAGQLFKIIIINNVHSQYE